MIALRPEIGRCAAGEGSDLEVREEECELETETLSQSLHCRSKLLTREFPPSSSLSTTTTPLLKVISLPKTFFHIHVCTFLQPYLHALDIHLSSIKRLAIIPIVSGPIRNICIQTISSFADLAKFSIWLNGRESSSLKYRLPSPKTMMQSPKSQR